MWSAPPGGHGQDSAIASVEQARRFLNQQQASFVIASGSRILTWSSRPGALALVEGIGEVLRAVGPRWLQQAGLAVERGGKAAALAAARWGLGGVYARAMTREAAAILERHGIPLFFDRWAGADESAAPEPGGSRREAGDRGMGPAAGAPRGAGGPDPAEQLVQGLEEDPAEAWRRLWAVLERRRQRSGEGGGTGDRPQEPGGGAW